MAKGDALRGRVLLYRCSAQAADTYDEAALFMCKTGATRVELCAKGVAVNTLHGEREHAVRTNCWPRSIEHDFVDVIRRVVEAPYLDGSDAIHAHRVELKVNGVVAAWKGTKNRPIRTARRPPPLKVA